MRLNRADLGEVIRGHLGGPGVQNRSVLSRAGLKAIDGPIVPEPTSQVKVNTV
jgi:hypothetical protein